MRCCSRYIDKRHAGRQERADRLQDGRDPALGPGIAQERMENLLTSTYKGGAKVDGVLSPYDGLSIGILSALKSSGYGTAGQPYPVVTGQDAEVASVKSIIAGEQYSTIYKDTRELAETTVADGRRVLKGRKPEDQQQQRLRQRREGRAVVPARVGDRRQEQLPEGARRLGLLHEPSSSWQ